MQADLQHGGPKGGTLRQLLHHARGRLQLLRHGIVAQSAQRLLQHPHVLLPACRGQGEAGGWRGGGG